MRGVLALALVLGVASAGAVAPTGSAAKSPSVTIPVAAIKPGEVLVEAVKLTVPFATQALRLRWSDPGRIGRTARAIVFSRVERAAKETTFRLFMVVEVPARGTRQVHAARMADDQPTGSGADVVFTPDNRLMCRALFTGKNPVKVKPFSGKGDLADLGFYLNLRLFVDKNGTKSNCDPSEVSAIDGPEVDTAAGGGWIDSHYDDGHAFGWDAANEPPVKIDLDRIGLDQLQSELDPLWNEAPRAAGTTQGSSTTSSTTPAGPEPTCGGTFDGMTLDIPTAASAAVGGEGWSVFWPVNALPGCADLPGAGQPYWQVRVFDSSGKLIAIAGDLAQKDDPAVFAGGDAAGVVSFHDGQVMLDLDFSWTKPDRPAQQPDGSTTCAGIGICLTGFVPAGSPPFQARVVLAWGNEVK
jgi:hypothetical protein